MRCCLCGRTERHPELLDCLPCFARAAADEDAPVVETGRAWCPVCGQDAADGGMCEICQRLLAGSR